jgi:hypothetical protein
MRKKIFILSAFAIATLVATACMAQTATPKPAAPPPAQATAKAPAEPQSGLQTEPAPPMGVAPTGKTRFEGTIANTVGSAFLGGWFNVQIDEWTTPEQAAELKQILATGGQKALLDKVWKAKQIGSLQVGNSLGKPLFFARAIPVPGGLIVRALTNSPLGRGSGRAGDYPFGFIELIIPNDGKGYGTIVGMAGIVLLPDGSPQIQAYGTIPAKIMDVAIAKK